MSESNKRAKEQLIELYGPECFIEKLHLRKDKEPRHYTGQNQYKRMKMLTYHHILEKRNGGKATVENGALLSAENHHWFNQQSPKEQARMNAIFQKYKHNVDCKVEFVDDLDIDFFVEAQTFKLEKDGIKVTKATTKQKDKKYNRAKQKAKTRKAVQKYYRDRGER